MPSRLPVPAPAPFAAERECSGRPTTDDAENTRVMTYNDAIPALVKARADAGKHVTMADMYGAFTKNFIPRTAGAETIVAAVGDSITAGSPSSG